jgi:hypothetical protein
VTGSPLEAADDDWTRFNEITAGLDELDDLDVSPPAAGPRHAAPADTEPDLQTPPPVSRPEPEETRAADTTATDPEPAPRYRLAPTVEDSEAWLPPLPVEPRPPKEKKVQEKALAVGYCMSIGVGVVGQIASFGKVIADALPPHLWLAAYGAAALGAAFAEVTMVGTGAAALNRRYRRGTWFPLLFIACLVCAYATTLNVLHWAPISWGLAVMFGGGSLVGFVAHVVAEHMAAKDYEEKLAEYETAVAARKPPPAATPVVIEESAVVVTPVDEPVEVDDEPADAPLPPPKPAPAPEPSWTTAAEPELDASPTNPEPRTRPAPAAKPTTTSSPITKESAVELGVAQQATKPAQLRTVLAGVYGSEAAEAVSDSSYKRYCTTIREQLEAPS